MHNKSKIENIGIKLATTMTTKSNDDTNNKSNSSDDKNRSKDKNSG